MELANCMVALGGDRGNTVPKSRITPPEILVLLAIHGDESVYEIDPLEAEADVTLRAELTRLRNRYGAAKDRDENPVVEALFPGAGARLPQTLDELGLDESLFKAATRVAPKPKARRKKTDEGDGKADPFS